MNFDIISYRDKDDFLIEGIYEFLTTSQEVDPFFKKKYFIDNIGYCNWVYNEKEISFSLIFDPSNSYKPNRLNNYYDPIGSYILLIKIFFKL